MPHCTLEEHPIIIITVMIIILHIGTFHTDCSSKCIKVKKLECKMLRDKIEKRAEAVKQTSIRDKTLKYRNSKIQRNKGRHKNVNQRRA